MKNPIYKINNLSYSVNSNTIINIKNFEIHRGACYMFDGGMASGKTCFVNLVSKRIKKYSGTILYDDNNLNSVSKKHYLKDIAVVEQCPRRPFFKTAKKYIYDEVKKKHNDGSANKKVNDIINIMDLKYLIDKKVTSLTPSQFRWVDLSAKIASYPKVLIIDELEQHMSKKNLDLLSKILYRKCNYDGVSLIATTRNISFFTNLISVSITLNQGRITKVRSFSHRSKRK